MFNRIAVPLDGSALAEQALPEAIRLARYLNASIVLLQVVELPSIRIRSTTNDRPLIEAAELYLQGVCNAILDSKLTPPFEEERLDYRVVYDAKPAKLAEIAVAEKADLLVMTTHGRTGLSRLVMGSVATNLVRHSPLPVVLVRPQQIDPARSPGEYISQACAPENTHNPTRIVVPLDSLPGSEMSLEPAAALARQLKATIYLLNVVPVSEPVKQDSSTSEETAGSSDDARLIQQWKDEAFEYLEQIQLDLEKQGLSVVKVVRVGEPAEQIAQYINLAQPALLVMATHARDRLGRVLLGNLTEEVMNLSSQPVMMVHS
jgi:nucleotide-binding universal stress UspA family protein